MENEHAVYPHPMNQKESHKTPASIHLRDLKEAHEAEVYLPEHMFIKEYYSATPVTLKDSERVEIERFARSSAELLQKNYFPGFGVFPSGGVDENYYNQIWSRDFAHAGGSYYAEENFHAFIDSLDTILKYQRKDGALPYKVEREYGIIRLIPGLRVLAKPLFTLIEQQIFSKEVRALYEGEDGNGAEDTVPATIAATGEFFFSSWVGKEYFKERFPQFERAINFFRTKTDPDDGLAIITRTNPDWAESIQRKGKLGFTNILWARSLRLMEHMAGQSGETSKAFQYHDEYKKVKASILGKLYNTDEGYFRAEEHDDRLDTAASIFGALFLLNAEEALRVEKTLPTRVLHTSGLKNFDPPYPRKNIHWIYKLGGNSGYHNEFVWPWVTCQNILVKIKIALEHSNTDVREEYKREAVKDLFQMAKLFNDAGGAYEVWRPDKPFPAKSIFYSPPKNLMANLAAYQGAYIKLKKLGWI